MIYRPVSRLASDSIQPVGLLPSSFNLHLRARPTRRGPDLHLLFRLALTPLVDPVALRDIIASDTQNQPQPEEIHRLETAEHSDGDELREAALIAVFGPAEFKWTDGSECGESGPENAAVDVVAEIDPDRGEDGEIRADKGGVDVVEAFT